MEKRLRAPRAAAIQSLPMASAAAISLDLPAPKPRWSVRIHRAIQFLVRYLLAFFKMPYALSKLFNFQFQLPAATYAKPLGEVPGTILTRVDKRRGD